MMSNYIIDDNLTFTGPVLINMIVLFMMSVLVVCWTIIDCLFKKNNSEDHVSKQRTTITGPSYRSVSSSASSPLSIKIFPYSHDSFESNNCKYLVTRGLQNS